MKQKIQTKRLAISNVGKDSGKPTKMAAWEQATRDQMRIQGEGRKGLVGLGWGLPPPRGSAKVGFDPLGLPDSGRADMGYPLRLGLARNRDDPLVRWQIAASLARAKDSRERAVSGQRSGIAMPF